MLHEELIRLANDDAILEIGRKAVEDVAIEWRDSRLSEIRGNGIVVREANGEPSSTIRFGPETAIRIALKAIAEHLAKEA